MKIWDCGKYVDITIGQKVLVASCGSGRSYFGEFATLSYATAKHLVFTTESGAIVKTSKDTLNTIGKAAKEHYFVSLRVEGREEDPEFYHRNVRYWNEKKCCFEYR